MNPLLQQTQDSMLQKADPRLVPVINKVVLAGKKVMYSEQTRGMFIKQMQGGATPEAIGAGVAKLMGILQNQSKGTIPPKVMAPAATVLMCEGLQFLEDAGKIKVDQNFLAACGKSMGAALMQLVGATPEKLGTILAKAQGGQPPDAPQPAQPAPPTSIVGGAPQGAMQ